MIPVTKVKLIVDTYKTLEKELGSSKKVLKSYPCDSYNFKSKPFFSNIFSVTKPL